MRIKLKLFIFCLLYITLLIPLVYAESISLGDILDFPDNFSGKEVQIEGEVIGEPLNNPKGVWINISGQQKKIGVFIDDKRKIEEINQWGSYGTIGDQVRVEGIFYKECPDHQISDIHLQRLELISKGYKNEYTVAPSKVKLAKILSLICLVMGLIYLIRLRYGKRD